MENTLGSAAEVIRIQATIHAPVEVVWKNWNTPEDVTQWNAASADWHSPHAENDLREGGSFLYRMEAKDGSFGFDFRGVYDEVKENEVISYTMDDNRKVRVTFIGKGDSTEVVEEFEPEQSNSKEMQQQGWQAILNSFKNYVERK